MDISEAFQILKDERSLRVQRMLEGADNLEDGKFIDAVDIICQRFVTMHCILAKIYMNIK